MRAYTAWVIATGRGKNVLYLMTPAELDDRWTDDIDKAMQFGRRVDVRRVIREFDIEAARPLEHTFE